MSNSIALELNKTSHKYTRQKSFSTNSCNTQKIYVYILLVSTIFFILFQIHALTSPSSPPTPSPLSWASSRNMSLYDDDNSSQLITKLRQSVTFLPLKDLRYAHEALAGHTWFMSSLYDKNEKGEVQHQYFPSPESQGRLLCLQGNDTHDGSWNSYALAWEEALPYNATVLKGLTFVSYSHYSWGNIWHGLSAAFPFIGWHIKSGCEKPDRWVVYYQGEIRSGISEWLTHLLDATFGGKMKFEAFTQMNGPVCFERAVVMRHNEGGMSRERRVEGYDLLRCKARIYCNVSLMGRGADIDEKGVPKIALTMFMRTGARSFWNDSIVTKIFEKECLKVDGCGIKVAYTDNLSFCEQVSLMSATDILVSPHGAQLTNMFFMDKNSSVLEFFPKGWLKLAGVGQYVYHWLASWSDMKHRGAWRDPNGEPCPFPEDDIRCFSLWKGGKIGYNETYFTEWARSVLNDVKVNKMDEAAKRKESKQPLEPTTCQC
ncbi:hypothetical protein ACHQM5_023767 [Ranunculus cassubicifolius]